MEETRTSAGSGVETGLLRVFGRVMSTVREVGQELPAAADLNDALSIVVRGDRQIYMGIALLALGLLFLVLMD